MMELYRSPCGFPYAQLCSIELPVNDLDYNFCPPFTLEGTVVSGTVSECWNNWRLALRVVSYFDCRLYRVI